MAVIGWTQSDVDSIRAIIRSGAQTTSYSGGTTGSRTVTWFTMTELRAILAEMVAEVAEAAGTSSPRYTFAATRKGFGC